MTLETDRDLRARLARLDPMPASTPVTPPTSLRNQELLERAMLTTDHTTDAPAGGSRRKPVLLSAAASVLLVLGVGTVIATTGGSGAHPAIMTHKTSLSLKSPAGSGGVSIGSCIPFSVDILKGMPLAFGGTVTDLSAERVTLTVDRWFKGGNADLVTVAVPSGNTSIGTVDLVQGKRYLVTATDGTVNACGFTGEATPEFERSFEQAFTP